ncbi:MAG: MmcQ/YjbR family DNA-binding protein [Chloroflexi bacterium]|nr:MAG: MmcQ/YjbR family DNA-binding protein [Chloroflexota bacterium]
MTFAQLRLLCLSLPEVEERETWGEATFRVREKIFLMGSPEGERVSVKASLDDQAGLIEMDPSTFAISAYTGRYGWVTVTLETVAPDLMHRLVTAAWKRTATKRAVAQYEAAATSSTPGAAPPSAGTSARSRAGAPRLRTPRSSR